ncbi:MAG: sodium:alanine symporter family protein [Prevotellaceae bacterium]|nr:sodium:alanine symporter family protein [Prevotellaceae bacterium]
MKLYDTLSSLITSIDDCLWGWPMIVLLLGTHLYLTFRLGFPQRHLLRAIRLSVSKDEGARGDVSQFGALATSLAATIGTGNIVGVATAVALGGPGAVLWCWLTGVFGISTKYAEALLSVKYRESTGDGRTVGGPMYVLRNALHCRWGGVLFALFAAVASMGIGNMVQSNAISMLCGENYGVAPWLCGLVMAGAVALVILFGVKGIARVCSAFVPLMALLYVVGCVYILCLNHGQLLPAVRLIVVSAFSPRAVGGGFVGVGIMQTARYGIARGLFSNESGMGSAPIVAAAAQTRNPVRQALVSSSATFWDTVVICALTGLVLVTSVLAYGDISYGDGAVLTKMAFDKIPFLGKPLLTFGILTFAFSTMLGWSYYGERAAEYLGGRRLILPYRLVFILLVFVGATVRLSLVWDLADSMNALMAIPNLVSLLLLAGVVAKESREASL